MPKVSVVMPAYNAEKYIEEAIDSILNQTFKDFEFIIIDDGSKDKTAQIIKSYDDPRICYYKNDVNSGIVYSLNRGIDLSTGEYIARMDSDDIAMPQRFEKQLGFLQNNKSIAVLGSNYISFGEGIEESVSNSETDFSMAKAKLIFTPCVAHPTVMLRKEILDEHNLRYNPIFEGTEDYAFWWEIAKYADIAVHPDCLLKYRKHKSQVTKKINSASIMRFKNLVTERMNYLNIDLNDMQRDCIFDYTCGKSPIFTYEEICTFSDIMKKVVEHNKIIGMFDNNSIIKVVSNAVFECLLSDSITLNEKIKLALRLKSRKLISVMDTIKVIVVEMKKHI